MDTRRRKDDAETLYKAARGVIIYLSQCVMTHHQHWTLKHYERFRLALNSINSTEGLRRINIRNNLLVHNEVLNTFCVRVP
jgi:hypothetical protein